MTTITAERAQAGYALAADEGEAFWLLGMLQTIKIGRDDTDGRYGMAEIVVPEGIGSPWHVHPEEDEWFYILEGSMTFWVADTQLSLKAGSFAFGPKGVPHTFYAEAGGARALVGFAPMQFEGFQREAGEPAPERVLPPPLKAPRTSPGFPRSQSETASRSSAPQARRPATSPPPGDVRPLSRAGARPTLQSGGTRVRRQYHPHRQRPLPDRGPHPRRRCRRNRIRRPRADDDLPLPLRQSATKPFCDGTDETTNFAAANRTAHREGAQL